MGNLVWGRPYITHVGAPYDSPKFDLHVRMRTFYLPPPRFMYVGKILHQPSPLTASQLTVQLQSVTQWAFSSYATKVLSDGIAKYRPTDGVHWA